MSFLFIANLKPYKYTTDTNKKIHHPRLNHTYSIITYNISNTISHPIPNRTLYTKEKQIIITK